jgi:phosphoglycolate phosphatase-like HAD superfamily hydrolase
MDLKACIFDLDGVIVDTAKYHFMGACGKGTGLNYPRG